MSNLVQISLFDRGSAVKELVAKSINAKPSIKKDKNKQVVKNTLGEPVVTGHSVVLLPRKSETKADLADLTGLEGQALMLFEQEARQQLMEASFSHMAKLIASGNYTFDRARVNANGKFTLGIKPALGRSAILSEEELKKQAAALGFELVASDGAVKLTDGETELTIVKKVPEAATPANAAPATPAKKKAATLAKKKAAATPVATTPAKA